MPLYRFGIPSLELLGVPLLLVPSSAAWSLIYLILQISADPQTLISRAYCLRLFVFSTHMRFYIIIIVIDIIATTINITTR